MPGARCTRGLVCELVEDGAHEHTGQRRASDIPCAMALRRALPGERLFCLRRPSEALASSELDASTAAPGPHAFAVRFSRARQAQLSRPPHPCPSL